MNPEEEDYSYKSVPPKIIGYRKMGPLISNDSCQCCICALGKKIEAAFPRATLSPEQDTVLRELEEAWLNEGMDNDYHKAIMDGSWPNAVEILENALEKARAVAQKRKE